MWFRQIVVVKSVTERPARIVVKLVQDEEIGPDSLDDLRDVAGLLIVPVSEISGECPGRSRFSEALKVATRIDPPGRVDPATARRTEA